MNWYKLSQSFNRWQPIRFVNPLTRQNAAGVFDADLNNGNARVRLGDMVGKVTVVPIKDIQIIDENIQLQPGQQVNLVLYPTESPAQIIQYLGSGKYSIATQSNRQIIAPISGIVPL